MVEHVLRKEKTWDLTREHSNSTNISLLLPLTPWSISLHPGACHVTCMRITYNKFTPSTDRVIYVVLFISTRVCLLCVGSMTSRVKANHAPSPCDCDHSNTEDYMCLYKSMKSMTHWPHTLWVTFYWIPLPPSVFGLNQLHYYNNYVAGSQIMQIMATPPKSPPLVGHLVIEYY